MNVIHHGIITIGFGLLTATQVDAQQPTAVPAGAALPASGAASGVGPTRAKRPQRLRSPAELGRAATDPNQLQNEVVVRPQVSVPLGRQPPGPTPAEQRTVQAEGRANRGGVDDAAARCESETDAPSRASCKAALPRAAKPARH